MCITHLEQILKKLRWFWIFVMIFGLFVGVMGVYIINTSDYYFYNIRDNIVLFCTFLVFTSIGGLSTLDYLEQKSNEV